MSAQSSTDAPPSKVGTALAALILGWIAAVIPTAFAVGTLSYLLTGFLVIPCWLLLAVPLFIFLRPTSDFWRSWGSIPFGAIVGTTISSSFYYTVDGYPTPSFGEVLPFALSGAASGGTTLGTISWRNRMSQK